MVNSDEMNDSEMILEMKKVPSIAVMTSQKPPNLQISQDVWTCANNSATEQHSRGEISVAVEDIFH